ncbi:NADP-dependent oxidoreductase [Nocardia sp. CA-120079]|uniref:NADP-dependent oxidoreductase n=1 Tax=Nocardia sp. CA-120079 TaxID=3239974 RepID=UPI003D97E0C4
MAQLQGGGRILIHAAAGGVGHLAVQFAALRGASVIGTARAINHDFVAALGADTVIDYTTVDFTTAIHDVDVVLDLVGGEYGTRSLRVLGPRGRYITAQDSDATGDPRSRQVTGRPSPTALAAIARLVVDSRIRVHIDRVMSLADVAAAHRLAESGRIRGKLVLTPWPGDFLCPRQDTQNMGADACRRCVECCRPRADRVPLNSRDRGPNYANGTTAGVICLTDCQESSRSGVL